MIIKSSEQYKSLKPISPPIELPSLVVLSGLNGTGKTQLLEGISKYKITIQGYAQNQIKHIGHNTLAPNIGPAVSQDTVSESIQFALTVFNNYKKAKNQNPKLIFNNQGADAQQMKVVADI